MPSMKVAGILLAGLATTCFACLLPDKADEMPGDDAGVGGGFGDARRSDAGVSCSPTPSGCFCIAVEESFEPIPACSVSSLMISQGQGLCCDGDLLCECHAYVCRNDPNLEYCQCGTAFNVGMAVQGTVVSECPPKTIEQKCCLSPDTNSCICSRLDCDDGTVGVTKCSLAEVAVCPTGAGPVGACY